LSRQIVKMSLVDKELKFQNWRILSLFINIADLVFLTITLFYYDSAEYLSRRHVWSIWMFTR
jgi:hypothetical protein